MSEKNEKATAHKLQKAKEKGQVAKSTELNTCLSLLVMLGIITALWPIELLELKILFRQLLCSTVTLHMSLDTISQIHQLILSHLISLWLPVAVGGILTIILVNIIQTGMVWSFIPLVPDVKRLNLIQGFKKILSLKTFFEGLKSVFKLICAALLLGLIFKNQLPFLMKLVLGKPEESTEFIINFLLKLLFQLVLVLTLIACLDIFFTRWKFAKDNRMSKQEVKDEYKQKEGDPKIKSKIKYLQNQLRQKNASLIQIKTADVIITNPTHLAIALKYDRNVMPAPKVICKAQGEMVFEVKKLAQKHAIPVIENKPFARMLYHSIELNHWITADLFPIAATIFKEIYQQRNHK
ncbi:MAG TPA: EscU/YscU/HrcU family type III secretion system export apparatus switch protein [Legionella sp.]|nr:EscU/YscU/HrcU family type III secretion system export apparatus switch protein [Legionella sp.]